MAEPNSFEELDQEIGNVLDAKTTNFFELAERLKLDPKQDFAGADLSGTDFFRGNLVGANFVETNLCGANFAYANLQGANLTNANLGVLPSSYPARPQELNDLIAHYLVRARANVLTLHRVLLEGVLEHTLTCELVRARACARLLAYALGRVQALDSPLNRAHVYARALMLNSTLDSIRRLMHDNARVVRALIFDSTRVFDHALTRDLIRTIGGGASFYGANLTGVTLGSANVEGAIMIGCTGLSSSETAELERRGAIFDSSPGDQRDSRTSF